MLHEFLLDIEPSPENGNLEDTTFLSSFIRMLVKVKIQVFSLRGAPRTTLLVGPHLSCFLSGWMDPAHLNYSPLTFDRDDNGNFPSRYQRLAFYLEFF